MEDEDYYKFRDLIDARILETQKELDRLHKARKQLNNRLESYVVVLEPMFDGATSETYGTYLGITTNNAIQEFMRINNIIRLRDIRCYMRRYVSFEGMRFIIDSSEM